MTAIKTKNTPAIAQIGTTNFVGSAVLYSVPKKMTAGES